MYIVYCLVRVKQPESADLICRTVRQTLHLLQQPGHVGSTCAVKLDDPHVILIEEHWGSLGALRSWLNSPERARLLGQIEHLIESPPKVSIFEEKI